MVWFLAALAVFLAGGFISLAVGRFPRVACVLGATGAVVGGGMALVESLRTLIFAQPQSIDLPWPLPFGSANMELDALSAVFAAAIALVSMLAAIYGSQYLQSHAGHKNLGVSWFFFNLLAASMLLVVVARNGVLFLMSWELMSLASFFLVTLEDEKETVRRAGWTYLVAMHLGTAFLLVMFVLLGQNAETLDFDRLSAASTPSGILFLLALVGFGTKAGFIPMHVWLPEAHPAAPSHVSAVMSGVMIKTGIYGLLRILTMLGPPPAWWGWTLLGIGVVSAILGVLYALSQHDLKRMLAYCSVENIGVIAMGLGVGLLGIRYENPVMAVFGFTGALLHVINHAVFKSLLFLSAGSVLHATGTGELDRLGGLFKRMPTTGTVFLIGAAAISGLPPLNGFVSEFLIFRGALSAIGGEAPLTQTWPALGILVIGGLALTGGLAVACFTKAFGIAFLGEPRSDAAAHAHECGAAMRWPMGLLAGLCVVIGLAAPVWPMLLQPAVRVVMSSDIRANSALAATGPLCLWERANAVVESPLSLFEKGDGVGDAIQPLVGLSFGACIVFGLIVLLMNIRRRLLRGRRVEQAVTWDCGYVAPTPRMQYTASSFSRPLLLLFRLALQPHEEVHAPRGLFPKQASLQTRVPDMFRRRIYEPVFLGIAWIASKLRWLQEGRIQIYVLYIALTILVLLIWKLGG